RVLAQSSSFAPGTNGTSPGLVRVLRFDAETGEAFQEYEWALPATAGSGNMGYTADFSPSGRYVYATKIFGGGRLYRYDLEGASTGADVKATEQDLGSIGTTGGQVRRGPDVRMYIANHLGNALSVV